MSLNLSPATILLRYEENVAGERSRDYGGCGNNSKKFCNHVHWFKTSAQSFRIPIFLWTICLTHSFDIFRLSAISINHNLRSFGHPLGSSPFLWLKFLFDHSWTRGPTNRWGLIVICTIATFEYKRSINKLYTCSTKIYFLPGTAFFTWNYIYVQKRQTKLTTNGKSCIVSN